jgi:hypothetical protein
LVSSQMTANTARKTQNAVITRFARTRTRLQKPRGGRPTDFCLRTRTVHSRLVRTSVPGNS